MSVKPTALMTQYQNGQLASQDLQRMMVDYSAEARFDREMHDDIDLWADREHSKESNPFNRRD